MPPSAGSPRPMRSNFVVARHRLGVLDGGERTQELVHALARRDRSLFERTHRAGFSPLRTRW